jgi:4-hydroxy-2-oxoheptanedioate aldolase
MVYQCQPKIFVLTLFLPWYTLNEYEVIMYSSVVKRKLRNKEPILAGKVNFMNPKIVEMMGLMGFDCLWICNEHIYADNHLLDHLILACRATGMDSMLRRNMSGYQDLLQPLEMGVHGFMIPRIRQIDYLKQVVEYVKFPPEGRRGLDGVNADADFGLLPLTDYIKRANQETFIVAQIEDPEAITIVDEIAAIDGVDILFIGQGDLSLSLGIPGNIRHERIIKATEAVVNACEKHGKIAGIPALSAEDAARFIESGFRFFTTGADYTFIKKGLDQLRNDFSEVGFSFRSLNN